jgi:hypothetical protein
MDTANKYAVSANAALEMVKPLHSADKSAFDFWPQYSFDIRPKYYAHWFIMLRFFAHRGPAPAGVSQSL